MTKIKVRYVPSKYIGLFERLSGVVKLRLWWKKQ